MHQENNTKTERNIMTVVNSPFIVQLYYSF
jgi:hypothetical protein